MLCSELVMADNYPNLSLHFSLWCQKAIEGPVGQPKSVGGTGKRPKNTFICKTLGFSWIKSGAWFSVYVHENIILTVQPSCPIMPGFDKT